VYHTTGIGLDFETRIFPIPNRRIVTVLQKNYAQPIPREKCTFTAFSNKILLYGGLADKRICGDVWIFHHNDHQFLTWSKPIELKDGSRYGHSTTHLGDDKFIVFGGRNNTTFLSDLFILSVKLGTKFDIERHKISTVTTTPPSRMDHGATLVGNALWSFGGSHGMQTLGDLWCFNLDIGVWKEVNDSLNVSSPRSSFLMSSSNQTLILYSGSHGSSLISSDVLLFNTETMEWNRVPLQNPGSAKRSSRYQMRVTDVIESVGKCGYFAFSHVVYLSYIVLLGGKLLVDKTPSITNTISLIRTNINTKHISYGEWIYYSRIAGGSFGDVLKVFKKENPDTFFALKLFKPTDNDKDSLNTELKEILSQSKLNHPNCLEILDVFIQNYTLCFVMPLCDCSLDHYLVLKGEEWNHLLVKNSEKKKTEFEASLIKLLLGILKGIQYIHSDHMVHLDLKLENILMCSTESNSYQTNLTNMIPKISDFGLARRIIDKKDNSNYSIRGTTGFMAPESSEGVFGPAADMYSFGIIFYCVLCLQPVHTLKDLQTRPLLTTIESGYVWGETYVKWIEKLTSSNQKTRPTASDLREKMEKKLQLLVGSVNQEKSHEKTTEKVVSKLKAPKTHHSRIPSVSSTTTLDDQGSSLDNKELHSQSFILRKTSDESLLETGIIDNPFDRYKILNYLHDTKQECTSGSQYQNWIQKSNLIHSHKQLVDSGYDDLATLTSLTDSEINQFQIKTLKSCITQIDLDPIPRFTYIHPWLKYIRLERYQDFFDENDTMIDLVLIPKPDLLKLTLLFCDKSLPGHSKRFMIGIEQQKTQWKEKFM
jgi:serine/threonine protein kinase